MDKQVVKSNHVIEASYRLTLNEQRLILLCIEQISKGQAITPQTGFNVRASDLIDSFGINPKKAYTELKDVSEVLFNRFLTIYQPDPDEPKLESTRTRWITAIDYIPDEGRVKLYFAHKVIPYISMLESGFTRYSIEHVANMTSVYGIRFYELFKCWLMGDKSKIKSIGIDELKELLDLKGQYPSIKDFKLKVLERGLEDVNQRTDLQAAYETKKTGRRITDIEFVVKYKADAKPVPKHPARSDAALEQVDKPMTKQEAQRIEASVLATVHPMLKPVDKVTQEQALQEFEKLKAMAEAINSSDVQGFVLKAAKPEFKEAFKQYGLIK